MHILRNARIALLSVLFIFSACTPSAAPASSTRTPHPNATPSGNSSVANTPIPAESNIRVAKEALRGVQVNVWHPWFGAEASLFESQVSKFNAENEWGIVVSGESKGNYSELFLQTDESLEEATYPQIAIAFPEHALKWQDHVVDLKPYVSDPVYGWSPFDISDFPTVIWNQDEVDGKRFGVPAQRTARFLLYNQSWARELGFDSPPATSAEFEKQICAAHRALGSDEDPNNDALGGWLIDRQPSAGSPRAETVPAKAGTVFCGGGRWTPMHASRPRLKPLSNTLTTT
jgi:ABC-type glycerol-3-phosphate transport system substrate-binding protein